MALSPPVHAALLMLLGSATVGAMNCTIRILSADLHPFEIAFFRNLFGLLVMLPLLGAGLAPCARAASASSRCPASAT
jgi:drug/metabolite transporter (DMT)-like permease